MPPWAKASSADRGSVRDVEEKNVGRLGFRVDELRRGILAVG